MSEHYLGVDVGGTFTDLEYVSPSGEAVSIKVPSNSVQPAQSTLDGMDELLRREQLSKYDLRNLHHTHGTTIAVNALIQRRGANLGMIVNRGFRDVLELARLALPHPMRYDSRRPTPLVRRSMIKEIGGRLDAKGQELEPIVETDIARVAEELVGLGAEGIIVCLLHSYFDDRHERAVATHIERCDLDVFVELSSAVWPQAREYERAVMSTVNAFVRPAMEGYLDDLIAGLEQRGAAIEARITRSNGGMQRAETIRKGPVAALLSGPASGVAAAAAVAQQAGWRGADLITVDVGGTSADVGVVREGVPFLSSEEHIAEFPLLLPAVAVSSIGAGGGSELWLDEAGTMKVGPKSVGADPGPACYGHGSRIPALTDAFLVCGYLADGQELGGKLPISASLARQALEPLSKQLGRPVMDVAQGAISVAIAMMAAETRNVLAQRGVDLPNFGLVAFGGAGPLVGALLAEEVRLNRVLIPSRPGTLSAMGATLADAKADLVEPVYELLDDVTSGKVRKLHESLSSRAENWLDKEAESLHITERRITFAADMRYRGQGYDVTVPLDEAWLVHGELEHLVQAFHEAHWAAYGHSDTSRSVWLKDLRAHVVGATPRPQYQRLQEGAGATSSGTRTVHIHGAAHEAHLYDRLGLGESDSIEGPAIVTQLDTTTLVPRGWHAEVLKCGSLVLTTAGMA